MNQQQLPLSNTQTSAAICFSQTETHRMMRKEERLLDSSWLPSWLQRFFSLSFKFINRIKNTRPRNLGTLITDPGFLESKMLLRRPNQRLRIQLLLIVLCAIITKSVQGLIRRSGAIEDSPTDGYAPVFVTCPANFTVRQPSGRTFVGEKESAYVNEKTSRSNPVWRSYLERAQLDDFDIESFLPSNPIPGETLPNIGLAISGGGIRALLGCAGVLNAFDDRNEQANLAGTGGILQLSNYITGLSGGSWLIGSWATSDFPTFTSLNESIWDLTEKSSYASWNSIKRYPQAIKQAELKHKAGFPSSLADVQAYILSHHLINDTHHGTKVRFSSIRNTTGYKNYTAPFPILLSTSRHQGKSTIDLNTTIYEFNPEEFGVNHPSLNAYIPMDYLGSHLNSGKPISNNSCALGFDNAGWVISASSNVLSQPGVSASLLSSSWQTLETKAYNTITRNIYDEAIVPNPFYKLQKENSSFMYEDQNQKELYLADGGWGGEVVPFWPLLQPDRKLDAIIAIDYVADGPSMYHGAYPNGTSLWMTYQKTKMPGYEHIPFPTIPDPMGPFTQKGLDRRPSFFGCNETKSPLIIYLPNYFVVADTKTATMKTEYTSAEINGFFTNSFEIATQSSGQTNSNGFKIDNQMEEMIERTGPIVDTDWKSCLACGLIGRQIQRNQISLSAQCRACFDMYCA